MLTSKSADRVVQVLEAFSLDKPQLTFMELQNITGITQSTLQRICGSLERSGYIFRSEGERKYELGIALMGRSHIVAGQQRFQTEIATDVVELAALTNASANLSIVQNGICYLLARVPKPGSHDLRNYAGKSYPPEKTAMGLAIVAWEKEDGAFSRKPARNAPDLIDLLQKIRSDGYAIDRGGWSPDVYAVAAPIRDGSGNVVGALGVADSILYVDKEREQKLIDIVLSISRRASARRGFDYGY